MARSCPTVLSFFSTALTFLVNGGGGMGIQKGTNLEEEENNPKSKSCQILTPG